MAGLEETHSGMLRWEWISDFGIAKKIELRLRRSCTRIPANCSNSRELISEINDDGRSRRTYVAIVLLILFKVR